jgi:hypothetical protein
MGLECSVIESNIACQAGLTDAVLQAPVHLLDDVVLTFPKESTRGLNTLPFIPI